jgi:PKD repeat protein
LKFNALGLYTVSLETTNANGSSTQSKTNYIQVVGLNRESQTPLQVIIFPNPSNGIIHVKGLPSEVALNAYDVNGRCVSSVVTTDSGEALDWELHTPGVYFLQAFYQGKWQNLGKVWINK